MRFRWLAVVMLLGAVAMSANIEAQNKRTASMSVRVLVVRPCLVNTAGTSGSELNCEVPGAPAPRMNTTPFQGAQPGLTPGQPQTPAFGAAAPGTSSPITPAPAAMTTLSGGGNTGSSNGSTGNDGTVVADAGGSIASTDAAPIVTTNGDGSFVASPGTSDTSGPVQRMEGMRVLTVNF